MRRNNLYFINNLTFYFICNLFAFLLNTFFQVCIPSFGSVRRIYLSLPTFNKLKKTNVLLTYLHKEVTTYLDSVLTTIYYTIKFIS